MDPNCHHLFQFQVSLCHWFSSSFYSSLIHSFIHSFIHSRISKAPLQVTYSEAPPAQPPRTKICFAVVGLGGLLSNLQNACSLLLGFLSRRRTSKESSFQVVRPTMKNSRRCLVAIEARGTKSWPVTEERRDRRPDTIDRPNRTAELAKICRGATKKAPSDQKEHRLVKDPSNASEHSLTNSCSQLGRSFPLHTIKHFPLF